MEQGALVSAVVCPSCESTSSAKDVYGGKYDIIMVNIDCHHCDKGFCGPIETWVGQSCKNCGEIILDSTEEESKSLASDIDSTDPAVRMRAVKDVTDQSILHEIVMNDSDVEVRSLALENLNDEEMLIDYIFHSKEDRRSSFVTAIRKIDNQNALVEIALPPELPKGDILELLNATNSRNRFNGAHGGPCRAAAVHKIVDKDILLEIKCSDDDERVLSAVSSRENSLAAQQRKVSSREDSVAEQQRKEKPWWKIW